jgi:hypothetical protein
MSYECTVGSYGSWMPAFAGIQEPYRQLQAALERQEHFCPRSFVIGGKVCKNVFSSARAV